VATTDGAEEEEEEEEEGCTGRAHKEGFIRNNVYDALRDNKAGALLLLSSSSSSWPTSL
jgi:hypothetical protein